MAPPALTMGSQSGLKPLELGQTHPRAPDKVESKRGDHLSTHTHDRRAMNRTGTTLGLTAIMVAAATVLIPGAADAGVPRAAPKSECRAAARIIVAIDHRQRVWSDDLSFAGMPKYVDEYNERLAARQPYPDPAGPAQVRAWLADQISNGCSGAVAPAR